ARSRTAHGETGRARADLAREVREHTVEGDGPEVLPAPVPEADGPVLALPLADDEHVRDLPDLRLADPVAELLIAVVELRSPERVQNVDVDFGPVERSVARVEVIREPIRLQRVVQGPLGRLPLLVRPHRFRRPRRELEEGVEREGLVPVANQFKKLPDLVLEL